MMGGGVEQLKPYARFVETRFCMSGAGGHYRSSTFSKRARRKIDRLLYLATNGHTSTLERDIVSRERAQGLTLGNDAEMTARLFRLSPRRLAM